MLLYYPFGWGGSRIPQRSKTRWQAPFEERICSSCLRSAKKAGAAVIYNNGHNQISAWTPEAAQFIEAYDLYPVLIEDWKGEAVYELKVLTTDRALLEKINRRIPALANPAICAIQAAI